MQNVPSFRVINIQKKCTTQAKVSFITLQKRYPVINGSTLNFSSVFAIHKRHTISLPSLMKVSRNQALTSTS